MNKEKEIDLSKEQPTFRVGDLVKHLLGVECVVINIFDAMFNKETGKKEPLERVVFEIQYLNKNGDIQTTRATDEFLERYV